MPTAWPLDVARHRLMENLDRDSSIQLVIVSKVDLALIQLQERQAGGYSHGGYWVGSEFLKCFGRLRISVDASPCGRPISLGRIDGRQRLRRSTVIRPQQ